MPGCRNICGKPLDMSYVMPRYIILILLLLISLSSVSSAQQKKWRIFVVNSYHKEYLSEQEKNEGFYAALLDFKFLENKAQIEELSDKDFIETDNVVIKRDWMDSKRKSSKREMEESATQILKDISAFKPDLIMVGDDNACFYIGSQYIDSTIPVVFRGIAGSPMKYGFVDSIEHPGHNITGVMKLGFPSETLNYFVKLIPAAKTFAILADASETSRAKAKQIYLFLESGKSPLKLVDSVSTNSYQEWQASALKLQDKVDAFYVLNHNTLKDPTGASIDPLAAMKWYLGNIKKPECTWEKQFVQEGALMTVDQSAYKQGYEIVRLASMILHDKKNPADIPCINPGRGPVIVNRQRAQMLGIDLSDKKFIEQYVDKALALEPAQETSKQ
jgi:ABC-type uncharacterized transport system substrate-binding protein